jgi:pentose-5-phosphate-3-epimerase
MQIIPSIIPHSKQELADQLALVAPFAKLAQVDICDGVFTREKTWPYNFVDTDFFDELKREETGWPKWEDLEIEIHLMVKNPETVCEDWIKTGVSSIVAHIESTQNFQKVIDTCRELNVAVWIAIKPATGVALLAPFAAQVDGIQVMGSNNLGEHGVPLDDAAVQKIKLLRQMYPESIIAIDIGVSLETKDELVSAGAAKLISGSAILDAENPKEVFDELSV